MDSKPSQKTPGPKPKGPSNIVSPTPSVGSLLSGEQLVVPLHVEKQLAEDIESTGGIKAYIGGHHLLARIVFDNNKELYGGPGDLLRRKLTKKVTAWKKYHEEGRYEQKVLSKFGVKAARFRRNNDNDEYVPTDFSDNSSGEDKKSPSVPSHQLKSPATKLRKRKPPAEEPPKVIEAKIESNMTDDDINERMANLNLTAPRSPSAPTPRNTQRIIVNVDRPEDNGEVMVLPTSNIPGIDKKSYYEGYFMIMGMDSRHIIDDSTKDHYKGRVFTNNSVLLSKPSFSYPLENDRDEYEALLPPHLLDAVDNAVHGFNENRQARFYRHLLLEFPHGHDFTSKDIYEDAGDDEELDFILMPLDGYHETDGEQTTDDNGEPMTFPSEQIGFLVARRDMETRKKGKVKQEPKLSKAARRMLSRRHGGRDGAGDANLGETH